MVKTTWTAAPDPPYADEADLLIRSLTTLLYLLPQPPATSDTDSELSQRGSHQRRRGRTSSRGVILDRAALLFVSGHESGDAAAVNAIIRPYEGVHVFVVKERPRGLELVPLDDDGKRWTVLDPRFVKPPSPVDLALELSKDDIACLLRHGQYVIPPDVHVEHLVGLFHRAFGSNSETQDDNRRRLKRYVLLYCVSKIKERFDAEWTPGGEIRFRDLFIATDGPHATFSFQEYQSLSPPESDQGLPEFPRMPDDESWILRWLRSYGYDLDTDPNDQTKILWTPESGMYVYRCICANINTARICLAQLEKALKTSDVCEDEGMRYKRTIGALDKLAEALEMICLAVHRSPTFWKTMHTLQPLIQRHLHKSRIGSVPGKGGTYPTDPNPAEDNCAYELDDLADDPDLRCLSLEAQKLRHWLILLSQWTSSISKLGPLLNKFSRSSPSTVTVWAKYADPPIRNREQASLFETLDYVETKLSMTARVQVLKNAASKSNVKARALDIIRRARANEDPSEWLSAFEGGIHCEAQLSEGWQYTELPCHSVGTSRRCCFCCDVLLDCHSLRTGRSSTGEVVPWTPPLGLDPLIKEKILQHLIAKLQRFFMEEPSPSQLLPPFRSLRDPLLLGTFVGSLKRKRST